MLQAWIRMEPAKSTVEQAVLLKNRMQRGHNLPRVSSVSHDADVLTAQLPGYRAT